MMTPKTPDKVQGLQCTINKQQLIDAVAKALLVVEHKSTIPVISQLKIGAVDADTIRVIATDLDKALILTVPAKVEHAGVCTMPAYQLQKTLVTLKTIDDPEVKLRVKSASDFWVELACADFKVKLPGMDPEKYPAIPSMQSEMADTAKWNGSQDVIEVKTLRDMIGRTFHAMAVEEIRYTLQGAQLTIQPDSIRMVTTDGHRLVNMLKNGSSYNGGTKTLIMRNSLEVLGRLLNKCGGELLFACSDDLSTATAGRQFFQYDNWEFSSRTLVGQFPRWEAVMPLQDRLVSDATVEAGKLQQALKRIGQYTGISGSTKFELLMGKGLKLSASDVEAGDAEELVACAIHTPGGKVESIGFDYNKVLDILGTFDKGQMVRLQVQSGDYAAQWVPYGSDGREQYDLKFVLMPMRI